MRTVAAVGAPAAKAPLERMTIPRRAVGARDVEIDIRFSGICHTDLVQTRDGWGPGIYPMVPGHEITGVVARAGGEVTAFAPGDRVAVGTYVDACGRCARCLAGLEVYCAEGPTYVYNMLDRAGEPTYGGFSSSIVVGERFVMRVPDALDLDVAAPLLCAGITTYSPLRHWNAGPGTRVAVLGMGGLGHLGVQFAHALGAEVTVLSRTLAKQDDGIALGADHYHATSDPATFERLASSFDLILCTISSGIRFDQYLGLLDLDGTLVNVGAPDEPVTMDNLTLIGGRRSYAASSTGGLRETQEMLDFAAAHDIKALVEHVEPDGINDAFERLDRADVRYRFVVDMARL